MNSCAEAPKPGKLEGVTERLARACSRHPWRTIGAWIGALVLAFAAIALLLPGNLTSNGGAAGNPEFRQAERIEFSAFPYNPRLNFSDIVLVRSSRYNVYDTSDIKPVNQLVERENGSSGFEVAITGNNVRDNDFDELSQHDLKSGELEFGLPAALIILVLVFGSVVAGLVPLLLAILSIGVALGFVALLSQAFSLSIFIVNMLTGMGLALGVDYSL